MATKLGSTHPRVLSPLQPPRLGRIRLASLLAGVFLLALVVGGPGCFLFQDGYPDNSCRENYDCFQAAGEVCNKAIGECEVPIDAAVIPTYDAAPQPDAGGDGDGDGDGDD